MGALLLFILFALLQHGPQDAIAQIVSNDVRLDIISPIDGSEVMSQTILYLSAAVNIELGDGPISDAVRSDPTNFELCVVWDVLDFDVKSPDSCRVVVVGGELPNYPQRTVANRLGTHKFRAYLRTRHNFFNPYPLAMNESSYTIIDTLSKSSKVYASTPSSNCRAAVCVSGQWRTFSDHDVRELFRQNLIGGLSGSRYGPPTCDIDLFFFAKTTDEVTDRNYFFGRTVSAPTDADKIKEVIISEFPELVSDQVDSSNNDGDVVDTENGAMSYQVKITHLDHSYPFASRLLPDNLQTINEESNEELNDQKWFSDHIGVVWPALSSVAESFQMVKTYEKTKKFKYDWVVRTRFDLSYILPLPALASGFYDNKSVNLPYTSLPISDVFAVMPRNIAPAYMEANLECLNESLTSKDFQRGAGPTEEFLLRHLMAYQAPIRLVDFPISIVRPFPDSRCQGLPILGLACMTLLGIPSYGRPFQDSHACSAATALAMTDRCDRMLQDAGRGPQFKAIDDGHKLEIVNSMLGFINETVKAFSLDSSDRHQDSQVEVDGKNEVEDIFPVMHSITLEANQVVVNQNRHAGWAVPRSVIVIYHQHHRETVLARKAIACLFLDYLFHSEHKRQSMFSEERQRWWLELSQRSSSMSSELASCYDKKSDMAVSRWLQEWGSSSWKNMVDFKIK